MTSASDVLRFVGRELAKWDQFVRVLNAGGTPSLNFPANKPLEVAPGDKITLKSIGWGKDRAPQVWLVIQGTTRHKSGHQTVHYIARDDRPHFMHRDSSHGYTNNPALALDKEAEAVDGVAQARFTKDAEAERTGAWDESRARLTAELRKLEDDPAVSRFSSKLRYIERQLQQLDDKVKKAA